MKKIILFMTDAVRPDYLSCYGSDNLTPAIEKLADSGVVFNECYTVAPWTAPSFYSLISGKYQSQHGIGWNNQHIDIQEGTRIQEFRELGYETILLTDCYWVSREFGYGDIFDRNYEFWNYVHNGGKRIGLLGKIWNRLMRKFFYRPGMNDTRILKKLKRLVQSDQKQLIIVHLMSAHLPLNPGQLEINIKGVASGEIKLEPDIIERYKREYSSAIRKLDSMIGDFKDYLQEQDYLDESLLGIFSDHGENLGENGLIDHQLSLSYYLMKIPFILSNPGFRESKRIDKRISNIDILNIVKFCIDQDFHQKDFISSVPDREYVFAEYLDYPNWKDEAGNSIIKKELINTFKSVIHKDFKLTLDSRHNGFLYNIKKDPGEQVDLSKENMEMFSQLKEKVISELGLPAGGEGSDIQADSTLRENLEGLGYL